jgi:hypothetical protein
MTAVADRNFTEVLETLAQNGLDAEHQQVLIDNWEENSLSYSNKIRDKPIAVSEEL